MKINLSQALKVTKKRFPAIAALLFAALFLSELPDSWIEYIPINIDDLISAFICNKGAIKLATRLGISEGFDCKNPNTINYSTLPFMGRYFLWIFALITFPRLPWLFRQIFPSVPQFLEWPIKCTGDPLRPEHTPPLLFLGRDEERKSLRAFAWDTLKAKQLQIYAVYGGLGSGKTRLALEWMKELAVIRRRSWLGLNKPLWDVGIVRVLPHEEEIRNWKPRRATIIVCDGISCDQEMKSFVELLAEKTKDGLPLCLLLVNDVEPTYDVGNVKDRETGKEASHLWKDKNGNPVPFLQVTKPGQIELKEWTALAKAARAASGTEPQGKPLDETTIRDWVEGSGRSFKKFLRLALNRPLDTDVSNLLKRVGNDSVAKEILIVSILAGPVRLKKCAEAMTEAEIKTFDDVTRRRRLFPDARRSELRWLLPRPREEDVALQALPKLLANWGDTGAQSIVREAFKANLDTSMKTLRRLLAEVSWDESNMFIRNNLMETAREFRLRENDLARMEEIVNRFAREGVGLRWVQTWEEDIEFIASFWTNDPEIQFRRAMGAYNAISCYGKQLGSDGPWAGLMGAAIKRLEDIAARSSAEQWTNDPEIQLWCANGAYNAICCYCNQLGRDGPWAELMGAAIKRLEDIAARSSAEQWINDPEIQLERAKGAFNAISAYGDQLGRDGAWAELMGAAIKRLEDIAARSSAKQWINDPEIQLWCAMGAVNAISRYGNQLGRDGAWAELMGAAIKRLEDIAARSSAEQWINDPEIQLERAKGAVNATYSYGDQLGRDGPWAELMGAAIKRLEDIAARSSARPWINDPDIQLMRAKGAVNAIKHYGKQLGSDGPWAELMGAAIKRLEDIAARSSAEQWTNDPEIQLERANGAFNAISDYGDQLGRDSPWVELMGAAIKRLEDIAARSSAEQWTNDPDIQLGRAMGAVNAISDYGKQLGRDGAWAELMGAAIKRLEDIAARSSAEQWTNDPDIQLRRAKGAFIAAIAYSQYEPVPGDYNKAIQRFKRAWRRIPAHPEVCYWASCLNLPPFAWQDVQG